MIHRVASFMDCANPECDADDPPSSCAGSVPPGHAERAGDNPILACGHCGSVWYEHQYTESKVCCIIGNDNIHTWIDKPHIETYFLRPQPRDGSEELARGSKE